MSSESIDNKTTCGNPDCSVSETGKCIEGLSLDSCSYFGLETQANSDNLENIDPSISSPNVTLPLARTLSTNLASDSLKQGEARVIAIIGPSDSGKTSLIASVYDIFQVESIDAVKFSRSFSLQAFEQICHDTRAESRRTSPHNHRTPRGEVEFYHLELCNRKNSNRIILLLGDRAGEEYKNASDDITLIDDFCELHRADTVTILIDGERLLNSGTRHNIKSEILMIVQAIKDRGGLQNKPQVAMVLTKFDTIQKSPNISRATEDFNRIIEQTKNLLTGHISNISSFKVAASPKSGELARGYGVKPLLEYWLASILQQTVIVPVSNDMSRAFSRLNSLSDKLEG